MNAVKEDIVKQEIRVTNSEWYVMDCLWEEKRLSLMQMVPLLDERMGWSKSTCATMLRRMTKKNLIGYEENGKTKFFYPKVKKENVVVQETKDFLNRIYNGSVSLMMSSLVHQNRLSDKDIKELQEILDAEKDRLKKEQ